MNEAGSTRRKVSLMIPVYNESESLPQLFDEIDSLTAGLPDYDWEMLFVNDGSTDDSLELLRKKQRLDSRYRYIDLTRNFGKERAMQAGFDHVTGDCVVILDADLQHPLDVIPQMLGKWEEGFDDIYGRRIDRGKESVARKTMSLAFYRMLRSLADDKGTVLPNVGDFRLLDRACIEALRRLPESGRYTKGLFSYIGFRKAAVDFTPADRNAGRSKQNYPRLFSLAIDGITSHSVKPLRLATVIGAIVSLLALCYMVYIVLKTIIVGEPVQGFPTIMVTILFLGGMQLLCIGIIGEYLGRIFNEVKRRPNYFIREIDGLREDGHPSGDCRESACSSSSPQSS